MSLFNDFLNTCLIWCVMKSSSERHIQTIRLESILFLSEKLLDTPLTPIKYKLMTYMRMGRLKLNIWFLGLVSWVYFGTGCLVKVVYTIGYTDQPTLRYTSAIDFSMGRIYSDLAQGPYEGINWISFRSLFGSIGKSYFVSFEKIYPSS